jgi:hypothetical protein
MLVRPLSVSRTERGCSCGGATMPGLESTWSRYAPSTGLRATWSSRRRSAPRRHHVGKTPREERERQWRRGAQYRAGRHLPALPGTAPIDDAWILEEPRSDLRRSSAGVGFRRMSEIGDDGGRPLTPLSAQRPAPWSTGTSDPSVRPFLHE